MHGPHIHIPYNRIGDYLSFISDNKLNLEIYLSADVLDGLDVTSVKETCSRLDYAPLFSIHAPFMDLSPGAVDSRVREATMHRFNQTMDVASAIRPKTVVFHSGYEKWKYALNMDIWLEKSVITWREIVGRAADIGVKVSIENIFEDSPDNLRALAENINSEHFGLCFDTGHFNIFSKTSLDEWLERTGDYINELHLHDNDTKSDMHASIGSGTFDFNLLFKALQGREDVVYTIEAHSPEEVRESISVLRNVRFT